ncbi:hypothetical protein SAMN04487911_101266 [Arenibacter nanhaiticus]|uniref:Uncharacterized protein n=1 Tax=Arenibacter nanhaiticus TaxID=558155 RepID=A0A1M6AM41_9FLAO|nr:hypothetical protein [Arenibacter nanhaiticus]SHI37293.1 hypothetical protein SAMN04487911_101266 [Arenibacter nanhaiticus]
MVVENSILILSGTLGAVLAFVLSNKLNQGPVRASAMLSLVVAGFFYLFPKLLSPHLTQNIPLLFFGGTFIGMASSKIVSSYRFIGITGMVFSLFFLYASSYFEGYGGALGTAGCISFLVTFAVHKITRKRKIAYAKVYLRRYTPINYRKK